MSEPETVYLPVHFCYQCGCAVFEDDSPGVWRHADTEQMDGHDIDADHVAIPDFSTDEP